MIDIDIEDYLNWLEDVVRQIKGTDDEMRTELIRLASQIIADLKIR